MIISANTKATLDDFQNLMKKTDSLLNSDALSRPSYYCKRGGNMLEDDVASALGESAKGTVFENTIEKISGHSFPDIVAGKYYGVEVKSTIGDKWKSTGSSILESTRVSDVERIYITFGKLGGNPIEFLSRPYEKCLYDIAVTHMPRYLIDMQLNEGETIFDKLSVPYDELRSMDNPILPVSKYYRGLLKPGESLWWAGDSYDESVSSKIRLWKTLDATEKKKFTIFGCVNFPEVFGGDYDNYSLWLTSQGIVDPHIRDQFSAGGQEPLYLSDGSVVKFPGVYRRVKGNIDLFINLMRRKDTTSFDSSSFVSSEVLGNRIREWIDNASRSSSVDYYISMNALRTMFLGKISEKYLS